ncbi:hypothetical protein OO012_19745 [Rhodobacteraceae bacterium KMM 6894]|nr:hypothetical protein [Rhodobacteraceae bacterium KMM 6894]
MTNYLWCHHSSMSGEKKMVSETDSQAVLQTLPISPETSSIRLSNLVGPAFVLDAKAYQKEFAEALNRVEDWQDEVVALSTLADVFVPNRIKLVTTSESNHGATYLKAHDIFNVRPSSSRHLVKSRTQAYETLLLKKGMILTPSSGRNLGPLAFVGHALAGFGMTDIMRIVPHCPDKGYLLYAFLMTKTGQALIRRGRSGTNIDHLSPADVKKIPILVPDSGTTQSIIRSTKKAEELLDSARQALTDADRKLSSILKIKNYLPDEGVQRVAGLRRYTRNSASLSLRLDAAFYDPANINAGLELAKAGGRKLGELANLKMMGRYKRYYVDGENGTPIVSGRQLFQLRPVSLKHISDRSFSDPETFRLKKGWTVFTCDGRSEEALGHPALVSSHWNDWMASNHVMRAIPKDNTPPGFLYLALRNPLVQLQLKSRATGSVVDALDPKTIADVVLPTLDQAVMKELGEQVERAYENIGESQKLLAETVKKFQRTIDR